MAGEADIKPWHRVADAGFGDIVMQHGFRKVGQSMWRRDGDRVQWRVVLTKGYLDAPDSFRAVYGGWVPEIDELVKRYNGKPSSERMPGSSARMHVGSDIDGDIFHAQKTEWQLNHRYEKKSGWKRVKQILFEPPEEKFCSEFVDIPFYEHAGKRAHELAFTTSRGDISDIAETLANAWLRLGLPSIEEHIDFKDLYADHWGPNSTEFRYEIDFPTYFASAKLVGDQDWIERMAEDAFSLARMNHDELRTECKARGKFFKGRRNHPSEKDEAVVRKFQYENLRTAMTVVHLARTMEFDIPDHGIDFEKFEDTVKPYKW